jgi:hypothetical protein
MQEKEIVRQQYLAFKESGDLKILFPGMSGDWEKDKKRFTLIWEDSQRLLDEAAKDDY